MPIIVCSSQTDLRPAWWYVRTEIPDLASTVLAVLTGYGKEGDDDPALTATFDAHFTRPVDFGLLQAFIHERFVHDLINA